MRGSDPAYSTHFHAYLFVGLEAAIIFLDGSKVNERVVGYLKSVGVERRDYDDIWSFLRRREWGEGKVSRLSVIFSHLTTIGCASFLWHRKRVTNFP
jgi:hypothetical protein